MNKNMNASKDITLKDIVTILTNVGDAPLPVDFGNTTNSLQDGDVKPLVSVSSWIKLIFQKWKDVVQVMGVNDNSIYVPIMMCIDPNYETLELGKKSKYIDNLRNHLCKEVSKNEVFEKLGYKKLGWKKNVVVSAVKENEFIMEILRLLVDYFNINIFIIDDAERQIQVHYNEGYYSPFKENIFLLKTKIGFDLIILRNVVSSINYNDDFLQEFIKVHEKKFICLSYNQNNDAKIIRPFEQLEVGKQDIKYKDDISDIFYKQMKLNTIQEIAGEFNISIKMGKKFKTKNILYEEIKEKIASGEIDISKISKKIQISDPDNKITKSESKSESESESGSESENESESEKVKCKKQTKVQMAKLKKNVDVSSSENSEESSTESDSS